MNTQVQTIRSIALRSAANLFAVWYGFWGFFGGVTFASSNVKRLTVPLGLFIPFVDLHLNFSIQKAATLPGVIVQAAFFVLFCSATGWVSGLLAAYVYNLVSNHLGIQLHGTIEAKPLARR